MIRMPQPLLRCVLPLGLLLALTTLPGAANAADDWAWGDTSLNYLVWTQRTINRTNSASSGQKKDFPYVEVEGGRGGDWGDLYGFADVENPTNNTDNRHDGRADRRSAVRIEARFKITKFGNYPLMAYGHVYDFVDNGFGDQDRVYGFGTDLNFNLGGNLLAIKPFLGAHNEVKSGVGARANGGMTGYTLDFPFKVAGQSFGIGQWHETEFARQSEFSDFALGVSSKSPRYNTAENGALSLWWNPTKTWTAGISYRYAQNKLGIAGYQDGFIYTVRYHF